MSRWYVAMARRALHAVGLDVHRSSEWGHDDLADVKRIVGNRPGTILDIGANRGQSARRYMRAFPTARIFSFEPGPAALVDLRRLAERHSLLTVVPCAIGCCEGSGTMHITEASEGSSLLPIAGAPGAFGSWTKPVDSVAVTVRRLDLVAAELGIASAEIVKIDTQGLDLEVLRGAGDLLRPQVLRAVLVEMCFHTFYDGQGAPHEIFRLMESRGYRPIAMYAGSRESSGRLHWADVLFA
jgi:FkbM family methyltransferase